MKSKIYVGTDYAVGSDEYQWILYQNGGIRKKTGEINWKGVGFYATLESLFDELVDRQLRLSEYSSFDDLARNFKEYRKEARDALEGHLRKGV